MATIVLSLVEIFDQKAIWLDEYKPNIPTTKRQAFRLTEKNLKKCICEKIKLLYFCQKMTSQMKETFGEYIKRLRTENELTLTQLAAKLDLDSANLSKIENNKREFDEKRLELLASVFNLGIAQLRKEFFSDIIAKKIYENNCDSETLILAEQKVEYLKSKKNTTI